MAETEVTKCSEEKHVHECDCKIRTKCRVFSCEKLALPNGLACEYHKCVRDGCLRYVKDPEFHNYCRDCSRDYKYTGNHHETIENKKCSKDGCSQKVTDPRFKICWWCYQEIPIPNFNK